MYFEIEFTGAGPDVAEGLFPSGGGVYFVKYSGRWLIGRSDQADIAFLDDRHCSRKAAYLVVDDSGIYLEPIEQASPSHVDGQLISRKTQLIEGSVVEIGKQKFRIQKVETREVNSEFLDTAATLQGEKTTIMSASDMMQKPAGKAPAKIQIIEKSVFIGRIPNDRSAGNVALNHPTVSKRHAEIRKRDNTSYIRDKGSANGTFVNGKRIGGVVALTENDSVSIGPFAFYYSKSALHSVHFDEAAPVLETTGLSVDVKDRSNGKTLRILDDVNLSVSRGEFVCIVGSSGSGKSTLVNLLSRRAVPTAGGVNMKGVDLASNFEALKHDMAYVPQNNALHESLSLRQALQFAAKLRLQPDLTAKARDKVVTDAAKAVDLDARLDIKIKDLSGGQKKRASLASEILASPGVLFLDEVTSGLDESTDREIMALMRKRADAGMTVICVTHTLANIQAFCDKLVVMGKGGIPTFIGSPREALAFFEVETLGDIFDQLDRVGPTQWRERAKQHLKAFQNIRSSSPGAKQPMNAALPKGRNKTNIPRQLLILTHRSALLTLADTKFILMALIQSFMIGAMLGYAYSEFGDAGEEITSRIALLMALGTSALWLGTTSAASNIVGEALIFQRERDVSVSTIAFVLSKFIVSGVFSVIQVSLVLALTAFLAEDMPGNDAVQWAFMAMGALIGVGMGLAISAFSNTQEQANAIVPLALIPQLILAGVLVPALPELGVWFSKVSISAFWMTEGMTDVYIRYADTAPAQINPSTGRPEELEAESAFAAMAVLAIHLGGCLTGAVGLALNRFDRRR